VESASLSLVVITFRAFPVPIGCQPTKKQNRRVVVPAPRWIFPRSEPEQAFFTLARRALWLLEAGDTRQLNSNN
jgi:hypothetical protein